MKFRHITALIMLFCSIFLCISCGVQSKSAKHVLRAWTGDFSDEKLKDAITLYKSEYTAIDLDDSWQIVIPLEDTFSSYRLSRISYCDKDFGELTSYIDLAGITEYNAETRELTIDCSWLNDPDSWIYKHNIWSFLVNVTTESGEDVYYYVRITFDNTSVK